MRESCACDLSNVRVLPLDLASPLELPGRTREALNAFGRVDVIIHNGGVSQRSRAVDTQIDVTKTIFATNFLGPVAITKELLPEMIRQGGGHIAVVSSVLGKFGAPTRSSYAASKHALHGYFDSLRAEHWQDRIKVTMVVPGFIRTDISKNAFEADGSRHGAMDPGQEQGVPPHVCAEKILNAIARGKDEVLIGGLETWGVILKRFWPGMFARVIRSAKVDG